MQSRNRKQIRPDPKLNLHVLTQIQFSTEKMLQKWIEAANLIRSTTKRKTLLKEDLKNALRMNRLLSFNVPTELSYIINALNILFTKNNKHKTQTEYFNDAETESDREAEADE